MDATTAQPTLLNAARNFIRKSAGTAVLAIAPLAAVSLAPDAKAGVTIFGTPVTQTQNTGTASVTGSFPSGSRFSFQGGTANNITSMRLGADGTFTTVDVFSGSGTNAINTLWLHAPITGFDIPISTIIPIAYDFTLNMQVGTFLPVNWQLKVGITGEGAPVTIASGTQTVGSQTFTGSGNYTTLGNVISDGSKDIDIFLQLSYSTQDNYVLAVAMNSATQGITLNAIPEPSTYAAIFGLGALGFVIIRRTRRARAA